MTRKEEIIQAAIKEFPRFAERRIGFIIGATWADTNPHWISIKDEMPPRDEHYPSDSEPVLVYNPTQKYKVYIDWYIYDRCEDDDYIGWYSGNDGVTHWMLLPPEHFADVSKMMPKGGEQ